MLSKDKLRSLFDQLLARPFPQLGKVVGEFGLYDSVLAGLVSTILEGDEADIELVVEPDQEAEAMYQDLIGKRHLNDEEAEFVAYYRLVDELRNELLRASGG